MSDLATVAPEFVEMAHRIVWATVATVDGAGRPRSRVLHPIWEWDGSSLVGWAGTAPASPKARHLEHTAYASCTYWAPSHDTCTAECRARLLVDDETCRRVWALLKEAPEPLGYDPGGIGVPGWDSPTAPGFGVLRLDPWRLRVMPGVVMTEGRADLLLTWQQT
jgi:hypothetical protein